MKPGVTYNYDPETKTLKPEVKTTFIKTQEAAAAAAEAAKKKAESE